MASKEIYFNPLMVESLVKEEIQTRIHYGILSKPLIIFKNEDKLLTDGKTKVYNNNKKNMRKIESEIKLDPVAQFKIKEAAAIRQLETDDGVTRRNALIETNKLLIGLPKFEATKTQIYPMSAEEIRNLSIIPIISSNKESNMNGGLFDKRMGSIIRKEICVTCGRDDQGCGGHMSHIDLPQPMVNPIFEKEAIWTAQCTCSYCGDTFIDEKFFYALGLNKIPQKNLLKTVAELSNKWLWELHDHKLEKTVYENDFRGPKLCYTLGTNAKSPKFIRSVTRLAKIFSLIPPEKLKYLGFVGKTNPSSFIMYCIPCAPPHIRPPSVVNGRTVDHPLTERYTSILISIIRLNQHIGNDVDRENEFEVLHSHIKSIAFGPEKKMGVTVPLKEAGIFPGLSTKKGLIRGGMMGRRVNDCGRTVFAPGYELNVGEAMIPANAAKNINRTPIIVHQYNLAKVIIAYLKGEYKAIVMSLVSEKGSFPIKEEHIKEYIPRIGDILLRGIKNGDRGLMGRQPSLHKFSIVAFTFILNNWDTNKIHNLVNHMFNADFDGDEGTRHHLQEIMAMCEADTIMNMKNQIMNDQSHRPVQAPSFHALQGPYLMTKIWIINGKRCEVIIPEKRWNECMSLLSAISPRKATLEERLKRHKVPFFSGRALFSVTLPTNFTYNGGGLKIIDGVLVKGTLKKSNLGLKVMSLVQVIHKEYSNKEAARFLNDIQKISDWFIMWHGFSLGYRDFDANRTEVVKMLKKDLTKMQLEMFNLGPEPEEEISKFFWMRALHGIIDKTKINGKKIGEKFLKDNNALNILSEDRGAGVKGSLANTSQITASLGAQFKGSSIPKPELKGNTRCLPYFPSNDVSLESIGYIFRSYMDGLAPADMFFHLIASRITLIDTARNVSEIGYTHRRVEKALEQILISHLGIVVSTDGKMFMPFFASIWNVGKIIPVKNDKLGEKLYFCNPQQEADLVNRIYEKNVLGHIIPREYKNQELTFHEKFKLEHGRFPKFSEVPSE
jgi:DNA-directed RNA polymerase beta' subunit